MLAALFLAFVGDVTARWRCEPTAVEVGEPFALVLELEHPAVLPEGLTPRDLAGGALALDESWVVLGEDPLASADGRTRRAWRVASLEPGERALGESLSAFALPADVTRVQLGDAQVRVAGILGADEDAPRPLRAFPEDFADVPEAPAQNARAPWIAAGLALLAVLAAAVLFLRRRARRPAKAPEASPLERLGSLQAAPDGNARESCYALTRLLRESADHSTAKDRAGLTDEEWLAEVAAAHELPGAAVAELEAVLARAARIKYAGDVATPWALQETFAHARGALAALEGAGTAGGAR